MIFEPEQPSNMPSNTAQERLKEFFPPEADQLQSGMDVKFAEDNVESEMKKTNDSARADIICYGKEGKKVTGTPKGLDAKLWQDVKSQLNNSLPKEHLATLSTEIELEDKTLHIVAIFDNTKKGSSAISYYVKENSDFTYNTRTLLGSLNDDDYFKLTGKKREKSS